MVTEFLGDLKLAFDTLRIGIGAVRDIKDALPTQEQKQTLETAIEKAERSKRHRARG